MISKLLSTASTLSEIVTCFPGASRVLERHGIDYCCEGDRSLADACADREVSAEAALAEMDGELPAPPHARWDRLPVGDLIQHIFHAHHDSSRAALARLRGMAARVERAHADHESCPHGLAEHIGRLSEEIEDHLRREEAVVFPAIERGVLRGGASIDVVRRDHQDLMERLARARWLAKGFRPPPDACLTWVELYVGLARLEHGLQYHIHLENNVLFSRGGLVPSLSEGTRRR